MTAIETVKHEIREFLHATEPQVLCLVGKWGTGKTFAWRELIRSAADTQKLGLTKYSYVSLFGIGSLAELKATIAECMQILASEVEGVTKDKVRASSANLFLKNVRFLKNFTSAIPYVGKALADSQALYFPLVVNDAVVCLDDLDRHGANLRVEDVLGLVTSLREDRRCKVALLLNEDSLVPADKETLAKHFEKVVDIRLVFAPNPVEATAIALDGETGEYLDYIRDNCVKLGISNIRVIKKIVRLTRQIAPLIVDLSDDVKRQTAHSLAMFGWSKFEPGTAPTMDFLSVSSLARYMEKKEPTDQEAAWTALVDHYGFTVLDAYDRTLADYVQAGIPSLLVAIFDRTISKKHGRVRTVISSVAVGYLVTLALGALMTGPHHLSTYNLMFPFIGAGAAALCSLLSGLVDVA